MNYPLNFGPAGVPNCSKSRDTISGIRTVKELNLDCMEIEFVQGVRMKEDYARKVREVANGLKIKLSAHAPYFINLNAKERKKLEDSKRRLIDAVRIGYICGAKDIVFHAGYYLKDPRDIVYKNIKERLKEILNEIESYDVILRVETTGKVSQFGDLDEVISLSKDLDKVLPCIDFAHLHARTQALNSYEEFKSILEKLEKELGKEILRNMHIHISGIEYGKSGERRHLNLKESDLKYMDLIRVLKEFNVSGMVISESPNLEEDAILLKQIYIKL